MRLQSLSATLLVFLSCFVVCLQAADASNPEVIAFDLKSVSFVGEGNFIITEDDGAPTYSSPQWADNSSPLNRSANETGDRRYPVGYVKGSTPILTAVINANKELHSNWTIKVRGRGNQGVSIPETNCTFSGSIITLPETEADGQLPGYIDYYDTFDINWELKLNNDDWIAVGSSQNRLFVTLAAPIQETVYYSVVYHACRTAISQRLLSSAVPLIWTAFSSTQGPANTRKVIDTHPDINPCENGNALHYYNPWLNPPGTDPGRDWPSVDLSGLLRSENGQCTSWAEFWANCLMVHGYAEDQYIIVRPMMYYDSFWLRTGSLWGRDQIPMWRRRH